MLRHQQIKEQHELSVIASFISFLSTEGKDVQLIARPDPPDAIVIINGHKTWVEITGAYFSEEVAKRITASTANNKSTTICSSIIPACKTFSCNILRVSAILTFLPNASKSGS